MSRPSEQAIVEVMETCQRLNVSPPWVTWIGAQAMCDNDPARTVDYLRRLANKIEQDLALHRRPLDS